MKRNILILGGGGREHALAWKIAQSEITEKLFVAPGNGGTSQVSENVSINPEDFNVVGRFCMQNKISMVIVGPEAPLVKGIRDHFKNSPELQDIMLIGPSAAAAQLEGSKAFAKRFMEKYKIPTAAYKEFTINELQEGFEFLQHLKPPYVLKADGLAAGKGVVILESLADAQDELQNMLEGKFGEASETVVIEEFLEGIEFSVFALTDGSNYVLLPEAKDYKRIGEGDTGPNTGGMGAVSPVFLFDENLKNNVEEKIVKTTIAGIQKEEMEYVGFVFFGLIKTEAGPQVIEYNVRLGDPETEVVLPRLKSDLVELLEKAANGNLEGQSVDFKEDTAATVMVVSQGYPNSYEKGKPISGLQNVEDSIAFHAGTKEENGKIVTNGGRVMAFTSLGKNKEEALEKSYGSIKKVCYEGIEFRRDIGFDI